MFELQERTLPDSLETSGARLHSPTGAPPPLVQMLQIMMGHWIAQAAATLARLGVPDCLADGPRSTTELARLTEAKPDTLHRLLLPEAAVPSPVHLMDLNMLVMLDGRERSQREFAALFAEAQLELERTIDTAGLFSILEARLR